MIIRCSMKYVLRNTNKVLVNTELMVDQEELMEVIKELLRHTEYV